LLFILRVDADGGVPVHFCCADGNTSDVTTHIETWNTLRGIAGRADFLYLADSKLCSGDNMQHIAREGGRYVTVMPRSRQEDGQFRRWIQAGSPSWEQAGDRPNARARGPRRSTSSSRVGAATSNGSWTTRPSPTTSRATACIRC
jgi:hypothetical protein